MSNLILGPNFEYAHNYSVVVVTDNSQTANIVELPNVPYMFMPISTDKGANGEYISFTGSSGYADFIRRMGDNTSFRNNGQHYMTVKQHLLNGGYAVISRVCAPTDGLAAIILEVGISIRNEQKIDTEGNNIYVDADGNETTNDNGGTNAAKMVDKIYTRTRKTSATVTGIEGLEVVMASNQGAADTDGFKWYSYYGIAAKGQGSYGNNFKIQFASKPVPGLAAPMYDMSIIETTTTGDSIVERYDVSTSLDIVSGGLPVSINDVFELYSDFLDIAVDENIYNLLLTECEQAITDHIDQGATFEGLEFLLQPSADDAALKPWCIFDQTYTTGTDFGSQQKLEGGSTGWTGGFNWTDANSADKISEYVKTFDGQLSSEIYNTELFPVDYICDANFPWEIKEAIMAFIKKRFDIMYFMDMGIVKTNAQLLALAKTKDYNSRNIIVLPYNYKHRESDAEPSSIVTLPYIYSRLYLNHWINTGYHMPFCGSTVVPLPIDTRHLLPKVNDPQGYSDIAALKMVYINYNKAGAYIDSQVTGQTIDSAVSELHNTIILNRIIKKMVAVVDTYKHKLDTVENIAKCEVLGNEALDEFRSFVDTLSYSVGFKSAYEASKGILNDNLFVSFNRTIKKNRLNISILPKDYNISE